MQAWIGKGIGLSVALLIGAYLGYVAVNAYVWKPVRGANATSVAQQNLAQARLLTPIAKGEVKASELRPYIVGYAAMNAFLAYAGAAHPESTGDSPLHGHLIQLKRHQERLGIAGGAEGKGNFIDQELQAAIQAQ